MKPLTVRLFLWLCRKASYLLFGEELSKALGRIRANTGEEIDISRILPNFLKVRPEDCPKLRVTVCWQKWRGYGPNHYFYFDAHYAFLLWSEKSDRPVACVAFDPFGSCGVVIRQIQGKYGSAGNLKFIKWERLLIAAVQEWAKANGIRKIHIISACLSDYYCRERHNQMHMRYDVTARRVGMKFNPWTRIYGSRVSRLKLAA